LYFKEESPYLVADAYFSKGKVVDTIDSVGLHFISRLRDDANLKYLYKGELTGKQGRPKQYDGKVNPDKLNMNHFRKCFSNDEITIYSSIVYAKAFDRNINPAVAVFYKDGNEVCRKLYFSTDLNMDAVKIVRYYRSRFQIKFLYRDAKQHCGLTTCQARSQNKLNFHFNAALTAVNLAKIDWVNNNEQQRPFSMVNYKTMLYNELLLNRFMRMFAINPNIEKNKRIFQELIQWGKIAA
jgi:IS4 transposase